MSKRGVVLSANRRRLRGMVVVVVVSLTGLVTGPAVTTPAVAAPAVAAQLSPQAWGSSCTAGRLGLGSDNVELAPTLAGDTNPDGTRVAISPDVRGKYVPVIMVHGWTGKDTHRPARDGAFSKVIDLSANRLGQSDVTRSLIGQLQRDRGAAVFTFDYRDYNTDWVNDPHLGPALGKVIDCLYQASGEKVIIVGHSMGGLIARYAATHPGLTGGDRTGEISTVITFGTPETGSVAAANLDTAVNGAALTSSPLAVLRMILASCGQLRTTQIKTGSLCDTLPEFALVLYQPAARALRAGSAQLAALRPFPAGINIDALAGNVTFDVKDGGWFALPWNTTRVAMGDLVVTSDSAVQGATSSKQASCAYQLNGYRGISDQIALNYGLASKADVAQNPLNTLSGPCFHTQLMRGVELTGEAMGAVSDDINSRAPRLSTDGYGPVRFGMTLAEAQTALGGSITTQETGGSVCFQGSSAAAPNVNFAIVDGKVVAAGVAGGGQQEAIMTATTSGLHVGSSLAELRATLKGLTSRGYVSAAEVTEYDFTAPSGRAASFLVDDRTQRVTGFLFGDPKWVIGVEYICL